MYASTQNKREWLHVRDHCEAIDLVLQEGRAGETYNVGSAVEATIEEIADRVLELTGKPSSLKTIVPDRPGHDRRYLLDATKIAEELGWVADTRLRRRPRRDGCLVRGEPRVVGAAQGPGTRGGICLEVRAIAQGSGVSAENTKNEPRGATLDLLVRALVAAIVLVLVVSVAPASGQQTPSTSYGEAVFVVSGRGYGHGVGMSQYGAYGQALAGKHLRRDPRRTTTRARSSGGPGGRICAYCWPRGALRSRSRRAYRSRRSMLRARRTSFRRDSLTLRSDLVLAVRGRPGRPGAAARLPPGEERAARARRSAVPRQARGRPYRAVSYGSSTSFALESYLARRRRRRGAVQLARGGAEGPGGRRPLVRAGEPPQGEAVRPLRRRPQSGLSRRRRREAVDDRRQSTDTAGEVVTYGGKVATTYYFSTSGGKTASAADVFGFSVPYLVSRPDPWDKISPYHRWGPLLLGARTLQSKLGVESRVIDAAGDGDTVRPSACAHRRDDRWIRASSRYRSCAPPSACARRG